MANEQDSIDKLSATIGQLKDALATRKTDPAVVDADAIQASFVKALAEYHAANPPKDIPNRKGEGAVVPPEGVRIESGKFAGLKAHEVIFAHRLLTKARALSDSAGTPSRDLKDAYEKALTTTGAGTGDELVPTGMASKLWADVRLSALIAGNLGAFPMLTDPADWPLDFGDVTFRKGTQNTATTVSDPTTAKSIATSTEQVAEVNMSYDLNEDAIVAMLPALQSSLVAQGGEALDRFIMNADPESGGTGNVNSDDAAPNAASYYLTLGQAGIRRQVLVDNTAQGASAGGALTDALCRSTIAKLQKYASNPGECMIAVDPITYLSQFLGLTNVVTMDKYGPNATILTGELSRYSGVPVVVTPALELFDADGKYTTTSPAANNTKGSFYVFRRSMWALGSRRALTIEIDRDIQKRQLILVASFRVAVATRGTRASNKHTAGLYNITV